MSSTSSGSFRFLCANKSHLVAAPSKGIGTITVHEGGWAYCPSDKPEGVHTWEAVNALSLEEVVLRSRAAKGAVPASS